MTDTRTDAPSWTLATIQLHVAQAGLDVPGTDALLRLTHTGTWSDPATDGTELRHWVHATDVGPAGDLDRALDATIRAAAERAQELNALRFTGADTELLVFGYIGDGSMLGIDPGQVASLAQCGLRLRLTASTSER